MHLHVAIVTGGASGLGKEFATKILQEGGRVLISDVNKAVLEATGTELESKYGTNKICWVVQDVIDPASFHNVFDMASKYFESPVNLLVNNAGITGGLSFLDDDTPRSWEMAVSVNLTALIRGTQVAVQHFRKHLKGNEGVVVNLSSAAGLYPHPEMPVYSATKHGVVGFTRSLEYMKKKYNIRVVALCPAFADTAMGKGAQIYFPKSVAALGGLMDVSRVSDSFSAALNDTSNAGKCLRITSRSIEYFTHVGEPKHPAPKL